MLEAVARPLGVENDLFFAVPASQQGRLAQLEDDPGGEEMFGALPEDSPILKLGYSIGQFLTNAQETQHVFGVGGVGGSLANADKATNTTFALTKNRLAPTSPPRSHRRYRLQRRRRQLAGGDSRARRDAHRQGGPSSDELGTSGIHHGQLRLRRPLGLDRRLTARLMARINRPTVGF